MQFYCHICTVDPTVQFQSSLDFYVTILVLCTNALIEPPPPTPTQEVNVEKIEPHDGGFTRANTVFKKRRVKSKCLI